MVEVIVVHALYHSRLSAFSENPFNLNLSFEITCTVNAFMKKLGSRKYCIHRR